MNYEYSAENRLEHPHKYMYAPFGGNAFLGAYTADRHERSAALPEDSEAQDQDRVLQALRDPAFSGLGVSLSADTPAAAVSTGDAPPLALFSPDTTIETGPLLEALFATLLDRREAASRTIWLARLTQRFEVSKKLYQRYLPGFRKGDGPNDDVRLYALFSLTLALAWQIQPHLQYLSTMLKLNDLLLSLPPERLAKAFPANGVRLGVATELSGVARLAQEQGVRLEHA